MQKIQKPVHAGQQIEKSGDTSTSIETPTTNFEVLLNLPPHQYLLTSLYLPPEATSCIVVSLLGLFFTLMPQIQGKNLPYLLRVQQIFVDVLFTPHHSLVLVGSRVGITRSRPRGPPEQAVQVRPCTKSVKSVQASSTSTFSALSIFFLSIDLPQSSA